MTGGYLHPMSQNFQENGNHVEIFWMPNDETSFVQGHFHHVELNYETSHGFQSASGLGPDLQGPYVRRLDGGEFDVLGLDYRNRHQVATHLFFSEEAPTVPSLATFTSVPIATSPLWQTIKFEQFQDLDQLFLTADLGTSASSHLYFDNILIGVASDLLVDSFDSSALNGGTGWVDDNWAVTGLVAQGAIGQPQRTVVRIKNSGSMRRVASMTGIANPRLHVDMMVLNYEGSDRVELQVSADGVNFTTLREFNAADSDGVFYEYKFDLGFLAGEPFIEVALVANTTSPLTDYCFVDSLQIRGVDDGGSAPVVDAGENRTVVDASGTGSVSVLLDGSGSFDPDGSIVSYEWTEGAVLLGTAAVLAVELPYGEHVLTLTVVDDAGLVSSADVIVYCSPGDIASDDFQTNSWTGGSGDWIGAWAPTGLTTTGVIASDPSVLTRIRDTGSLSRTVDLSGVSFPRLSLRYMVADYELGDLAWVEVSSDGVNFTPIHEINSSVSDRVWRSLDLDLGAQVASSSFVVRFRTDTQLTNARDYIHFDEVVVLGARL